MHNLINIPNQLPNSKSAGLSLADFVAQTFTGGQQSGMKCGKRSHSTKSLESFTEMLGNKIASQENEPIALSEISRLMNAKFASAKDAKDAYKLANGKAYKSDNFYTQLEALDLYLDQADGSSKYFDVVRKVAKSAKQAFGYAGTIVDTNERSDSNEFAKLAINTWLAHTQNVRKDAFIEKFGIVSEDAELLDTVLNTATA